jgi:hypothetical protein
MLSDQLPPETMVYELLDFDGPFSEVAGDFDAQRRITVTITLEGFVEQADRMIEITGSTIDGGRSVDITEQIPVVLGPIGQEGQTKSLNAYMFPPGVAVVVPGFGVRGRIEIGVVDVAAPPGQEFADLRASAASRWHIVYQSGHQDLVQLERGERLGCRFVEVSGDPQTEGFTLFWD